MGCCCLVLLLLLFPLGLLVWAPPQVLLPSAVLCLSLSGLLCLAWDWIAGWGSGWPLLALWREKGTERGLLAPWDRAPAPLVVVCSQLLILLLLRLPPEARPAGPLLG